MICDKCRDTGITGGVVIYTVGSLRGISLEYVEAAEEARQMAVALARQDRALSDAEWKINSLALAQAEKLRACADLLEERERDAELNDEGCWGDVS